MFGNFIDNLKAKDNPVTQEFELHLCRSCKLVKVTPVFKAMLSVKFEQCDYMRALRM